MYLRKEGILLHLKTLVIEYNG